jgi:hypothetical protein
MEKRAGGGARSVEFADANDKDFCGAFDWLSGEYRRIVHTLEEGVSV